MIHKNTAKEEVKYSLLFIVLVIVPIFWAAFAAA